MIRVWMKKIRDVIGDRSREEVLAQLCPGHREELASRQNNSWRESAAGEMLLQAILAELGVTPEPEMWIWNRGEHGKPYITRDEEEGESIILPGGGRLEFNWSHSGEWIVCAVSDNSVGVDIQGKTQVRPAVMKHFYTVEEQEMVVQSEEPDQTFTELWTLREANAKWSGLGLTRETGAAAPFARTVTIEEEIVTVCSQELWDGEIHIG